MKNLDEHLHECLRGRICFIGIGNVERGDDGFGVRLAERLLDARLPDLVEVTQAGIDPEYVVGRYAGAGFDNIIFLDAVDFGGHPGSVVLLNSREINARFLQISTHKLSLGVLAKYIEDVGHTRVWLLGVQPASFKTSRHLSEVVEATTDTLAELIGGHFHQEANPC